MACSSWVGAQRSLGLRTSTALASKDVNCEPATPRAQDDGPAGVVLGLGTFGVDWWEDDEVQLPLTLEASLPVMGLNTHRSQTEGKLPCTVAREEGALDPPGCITICGPPQR